MPRFEPINEHTRQKGVLKKVVSDIDGHPKRWMLLGNEA